MRSFARDLGSDPAFGAQWALACLLFQASLPLVEIRHETCWGQERSAWARNPRSDRFSDWNPWAIGIPPATAAITCSAATPPWRRWSCSVSRRRPASASGAAGGGKRTGALAFSDDDRYVAWMTWARSLSGISEPGVINGRTLGG